MKTLKRPNGVLGEAKQQAGVMDGPAKEVLALGAGEPEFNPSKSTYKELGMVASICN